MARIQPFRAYRPPRDRAARVAAPPYDVLDTEEARAMAQGNPRSFLHISKPEIGLPADLDPHDPRVYAQGAENLKRFIEEGTLAREAAPAFYIYRQRMGQHTQTGIVAGASVDEYEAGLIKKHEFTRPDKEDDRTRHIDLLDANDEPVFLTYPAQSALRVRIAALQSAEPEYDFTTDDGIAHTLWVVKDPAAMAALTEAFAAVPALYVADGHHRSAAATRVRAARRQANPRHDGSEPYNAFLAVIFPHDEMKIMAYNRVVKDLHGRSPAEFLAALSGAFAISPTTHPEPEALHGFGMLLGERWYRLTAKPGSFPADDPVRSLDAAILQHNCLEPLLGIADPRRDKRIDFVGGIRGTAELERRCREGWAVAFALHPTSIDQLMAVADAGHVMPPKSTWFEPKLRSGLFVRPLGD
ncbi:MAG: DUF1015 domain-containing protein [Candidatus Eisenbacteria bacterium]|uniref:DUF1015 domain-containing protein n=1 Tax=Eiseniibacteriota bacterium TaxID=2212470 RepID=A0A938BL06_UNCEI|nr:DUF1015 domain-containing protein [Candidatus Eisenbacteria bacterium]